MLTYISGTSGLPKAAVLLLARSVLGAGGLNILIGLLPLFQNHSGCVYVQWHLHGAAGQVLCVQPLGGLCQVHRAGHPVHREDKQAPPAHPQLQGGGRALGQARVQHSLQNHQL